MTPKSIAERCRKMAASFWDAELLAAVLLREAADELERLDQMNDEFQETCLKMHIERDSARVDLAVTQKAKAENDERFMLERDEARAERDRYKAALEFVQHSLRHEQGWNRA